MTDIRDVVEFDFASIVRLNDAEVQHTSPMDLERLRLLVQMSGYSRVVIVEGQVAAFLIAFRNGAPYENHNYQWFGGRFTNFLYVDRIVVGQNFSGRGIGRKLYEDMFEFARAHGIKTVTCEYNIEPPNPASRAFHNVLGFKELGTQWIASGTKQVSLQAAET